LALCSHQSTAVSASARPSPYMPFIMDLGWIGLDREGRGRVGRWARLGWPRLDSQTMAWHGMEKILAREPITSPLFNDIYRPHRTAPQIWPVRSCPASILISLGYDRRNDSQKLIGRRGGQAWRSRPVWLCLEQISSAGISQKVAMPESSSSTTGP
jgi:hypothetical protein